MKDVTRAFLVLVLLSAARIATAQGTFTADLGAKVESAVREGEARPGGGRHRRHVVRDRVDQQAVHRRLHPAAAGGGESQR